MHEMSLALSVLRIVEDAARAHEGARVTAVRLEIGALAAVEPEALRFCFDAVTRDSIAAGARLDIDETPGGGWCLGCGKQVRIAAAGEACPLCGSYQVQATAGTAMRVKDFEIA
ncbi:MAG TPA: hydrogenase maturation nickel metallochaperone HypA [Burkholderiaceae bacterium]